MIFKYSIALLVFILVTLDVIHISTAKQCHTRTGISTITLPGCKEKKVASNGCDGHCMSSAIPRVSGGFAKTCSCCSPIKHVTKYVTLQCTNRAKRVALPVAVKCKCRPC